MYPPGGLTPPGVRQATHPVARATFCLVMGVLARGVLGTRGGSNCQASARTRCELSVHGGVRVCVSPEKVYTLYSVYAYISVAVPLHEDSSIERLCYHQRVKRFV